jgi:cysteine desulfurase/selenocysteine lyase
VGVLYARAALQPQLQPLVYGSQTFTEVSKNDFQLLSGVEKFEPGTPNIEGVIGLGAALDYLGGITMSQVQAHDQELVKYTLRKLKSSGLAQYLVAPPRRQVGIFALAHPKLHPHDFGLWLSQRMVAVRAGKACSDILMQQLELGRGVVRLSFGLYTRPADIDAFVAGYQQIIKELDG